MIHIKSRDFRVVGNQHIMSGRTIVHNGVYYLVLKAPTYNNKISVVGLEDGVEYDIQHGEVVEVVDLECQEKRRKGIGGMKK